MRKYIYLCFLLLPIIASAQVPQKQGLQEYMIPDKGDTIHFYVYNPDNIRKTKIFLYLQGSGELPMVNGDDQEPCCYNNWPRRLSIGFPKDYAFVYIQKVGLPYYVRNINSYEPGTAYIRRNNVINRAQVANKVVDYMAKNVIPQAKVIAVLGHSEGSDVAALLAVMNKKVSHLCFASGNGTPEVFNDILFTRRLMQQKLITPQAAQQRLDTLFAGLDSVYRNPKSTKDYFNGDTYQWNFAINQPPVENLLKLDIPIYLAIGSNDEKVPVETSDYIRAEFIRHQKTNLTYKVYLNYNHSFNETNASGETVDHFDELFKDFLGFINRH